MSRLASLSTPSRSRSSLSPSPGPSPATQQQQVDTTHHRMIRIVVSEIKSVHRTWDELVWIDGLKAGKGIIDEGTTMDNLLLTLESERPSLSPHLENMHVQKAALDAVISKLHKLLAKLSMLVDQAEKIFFEACRLQGAAWATEEPLWLSWTPEHFVNSLPPLVSLHNQHLATLSSLVQILMNPYTSFDDAKLTLERWRDLSMGGERWEGVREWEELVELEMSGGGEDEEVEEERSVGSARKKKGKR